MRPFAVSAAALPEKAPQHRKGEHGACPGCGVPLQADDPAAPGYFVVPKVLLDSSKVQDVYDGDDDDLLDDDMHDLDALLARANKDSDDVDDIGDLQPGDESEGWVTVTLSGSIGVDGEDMPAPEQNASLTEDERAEALRAAMDGDRADFAWLEQGDVSANMDYDEFAALDDEELEVLERELATIVEPSARPALSNKSAAKAAAARNREEMLARFDVSQSVVCARCYSLVHHQQVKNAEAEQALPSYDVAKEVVRRMVAMPERRACVLVVLDAMDVDGSLPRKCINDIYRRWEAKYRIDDGSDAIGDSAFAPANRARWSRPPPDLAVAVHKWDVMPTALSESRMLNFVRRRLADAGIPVKPSVLMLTSSYTMENIDALMKAIDDRVSPGPAQLWVVGSQNAGKSSLLNACKSRRFKKKQWSAYKEAAERRFAQELASVERHPRPEEVAAAAAMEDAQEDGPQRMSKRERAQVDAVAKMLQSPMAGGLTASFVAGTTLGAIPANGVLPRMRWRVFDTPGVESQDSPSRYLLATEYKALATSGRLRPRSWIVKEGACLSIGGLCAIHVKRLPNHVARGGEETGDARAVLTLWAASPLACHLGKFDGYAELRERHFGTPEMAPPVLASAASEKKLAEKAKRKVAKAHAHVPRDPEDIPRAERLATLPDFVHRGTVAVPEGSGVGGPRVDYYDRENVRASHDLSIFGVGWLSVSRASHGDGPIELDVYAYKGQGMSWRPTPLMEGVSPVYESSGFSDSQRSYNKGQQGAKVKGGVYVGRGAGARKSRRERDKSRKNKSRRTDDWRM